MTTIVWDGKTLAADTQACNSNLIADGEAQKIHVFPDPFRVYSKIITDENYTDDIILAVGIAGEYAHTLPILKWLKKEGGALEKFPSLDKFFGEKKEISINMILVTGEQVFEFVNGWSVIPGYTAIGSGYQLASSFLSIGYSAEEAVKATMKLDIYTGGNVAIWEKENEKFTMSNTETGELTYNGLEDVTCRGREKMSDISG